MIGIVWKVSRIAAKVLLSVLAITALLIGVTWTFLQTRRGGEMVRRFALPRVNDAIAGQIALGRFAFGGDRLTLENVVIYDPEARPVAHVARIDVVFSPLALLRRHVEVAVLNIRRPELALVQDARGLNLMRALAPRQAPPPGAGEGGAPDAGGRRGAIDVRALSVTDGVIDYRSSVGGGAGGAARHVHAAELSIHGSASLSDDRVAAQAAVTMRGGRLDARAAFDVPARRGHATARASLRGVALTMDGDLNRDAIAARVSVEAADLAATSRGLTRDFGLPRIAMAGDGRLDVVCGGTLAAPSLRVTARFPALAQGDARAGADRLGVDSGSRRARGPRCRRARVDAVARWADAAVAGGDRAGGGPERHRRARGDRRAATAARGSHRHAATRRTTGAEHRRASRRVSRGDLDAAPSRAAVVRGRDRPVRLRAGRRRATPGGRAAPGRARADRTPHHRAPRSRPVAPGAGSAGPRPGWDRRRRAAQRGHRVAAHRRRRSARRRPRPRPSQPVLRPIRAGRGRPRARAAARARAGRSGGGPLRSSRAVAAAQPACPDQPGRRRHRHRSRGRGGRDCRRRRRRGTAAAREGAGPRLDQARRPPRAAAPAGRGRREGAGVRRPTDRRSRPHRERRGQRQAHRARRDHRAGPREHRHHDAAVVAVDPSPAARRRDVRAHAVRDQGQRRPAASRGARARRQPARARRRDAVVGGGGLRHDRRAEGDRRHRCRGRGDRSVPPTDARIELDFDPGAVAARARVTRKGHPLLAAETRLGAPLGGLLRPARLAAAPLHVRAVLGPLSLQRLGLPPETDREAPRQLKGKLHADLAIDGTVGAPRVLLHAQAGDLALDNVAIGFAQIEATYADHRAKLDARLASGGGGTLHTTAAVTADLGYPAVLRGFDLRRAPFDVRLDAQQFDVRGLSGVTQQIRTVGGLLTASVTIRGTASDPRVAGKLEWKDGVLAVSEFGEFKEIHVALHGSEDDLVLDELAATSGPGRARITGNARHEAGRGYQLSADANLDRFPIYTEGQPLATVALAARVTGRVQLFDTRLKVDIDDARVALPEAERRKLQPLETPADVVLVDAGAPLNRAQAKKLKALLHTEPDKAAARRPPSLRLTVNAPRHLWVTGQDAKLELGVSPEFRVEIGETTQVFGQVTVHRGRVDVYGRRFDLKADSTLTFGGPPERPVLDVRADHTNATQKVTVLVTAKGPLDKLQISVTAPNRPELSESQLYTLILTGQLQFGGGTSGASPPTQAASLVGGFLVSKLQSTLAHRLPFDVFTIDTGGEGVRGTRLEAGRYLTDRFYVGYIGRVGSDPTRYQNRNAVHLEYQITARWEVEAEYGDLGTGTADLMWKKNY